MIKYTDEMMKMAKTLFPDNTQLHMMMKSGDPKVVDMVQARIGFYFDEDDIIKAFRNKKEQRILDMAKRAKAIRDLYHQMFMLMEKQSTMKAEKNGYGDCL